MDVTKEGVATHIAVAIKGKHWLLNVSYWFN